MTKEEVDLDFTFSNGELANFLENFASKIREGDVGLSFQGREEVEISPTEDNRVELEFTESDRQKKLELEITLRQEIETTEEGRPKISVEIV
ncbi:amphi-Trp domain-containing protein [Candidatus Nanohalococcus occultus]|uniref:amphi-Trp domain-containing protein n=1 Tax=Candidatus Nanohalococcus occultus TaxID=2978047 RepID=UPI0039E02889